MLLYFQGIRYGKALENVSKNISLFIWKNKENIIFELLKGSYNCYCQIINFKKLNGDNIVKITLCFIKNTTNTY
jgi:hypothetical protein